MKLLLTGASGFIGRGILQINPFEQYRQLVGLSGYSVIAPHGDRRTGRWAFLQNDLENWDRTQMILNELRPTVIWHLAAHSKPNACEIQPTATQFLNAELPVLLAEWCAKNNCYFAFMSSAQIFDGTSKKAYLPDSKPRPFNLYGFQKMMAEQGIQSVNPAAAILRISLAVGPPQTDTISFLQQWVETLQNGNTVPCFTDEVRSLTSPTEIVDVLQLLTENKASGIFHLGGGPPISRYQMGVALANALDIDADHIIPSKIADVEMPAFRPPNLILESPNLRALGYQHPDSYTVFDQVLRSI